MVWSREYYIDTEQADVIKILRTAQAQSLFDVNDNPTLNYLFWNIWYLAFDL